MSIEMGGVRHNGRHEPCPGSTWRAAVPLWFHEISLPVVSAILVFGNTARAAEFVSRETREWARSKTSYLLGRLPYVRHASDWRAFLVVS